VSKLKKTPLTFEPHKCVELQAAFSRIMSITGPPDIAVSCLNRDLRSGRLGSVLVESSPDGKETMTPLNSSYWEQRTVHAIGRRRLQVEPQVTAGHYYVRRADLDQWYPDPATPIMPAARQSDDTPSKPTTTSKHGHRRKPGPKVTKDWRRHVAGQVDRIMENEKRIPSAPELAQFSENKLGYQPDERAIQQLLRYLLGD
jgi:hypothetical protein